MRAIALIVLAALAVPSPAAAKWPKPAAGESASGAPEVMFSFDDGPDHRFTPRILKILRDRNIQAIFFWVGHRIDQRKRNAARRRAVATRAVLEGHLIGSHTVNHVHLCRLSSVAGGEEIDNAITELEKLTALPMTLFRAPYGDHCDRVKALLDERNLAHIHWDIDPHEWQDHNSERVAADIIHKIRNLDGRAMILMHDTKLVTVRALERVLNWIDAENKKRERRGLKKIRIVDASDWVAESLDPDVARFTKAMLSQTVLQLRNARSALIPGYPAKMVSR